MFRASVAILLTVGALNTTSHASDYPSRTITLVVPTSAGGAQDTAARIIASHLTPRLGKPIVVDNRPGAGTALGSGYVAGSRPDGYTLLLQTNALAALPALQKGIRFDPDADFTYISQYATSAMALVVNPAVFPVKSFNELVTAIRAKPEQFNYSSAGIGTQYHLGMEMLKHQLQLKIQHVPFRGGQLAMNALLAGQVELEMAPVNDVIPHVGSGRLTLIAVSGKNRSQLLPDAPTFEELGLKELDIDVYYFVAGPAGLPPELTSKLNSEIAGAFNDASVRQKFIAFGLTPEFSPSGQITQKLRSDIGRWKRFIADANIPTE